MKDLLTKRHLETAGLGAFFRPRDVAPIGVSFRQLQKLVEGGVVERIGSGLYRLSEVEPTEMETIAMVASAVPRAVVCLLTALRVHEIGTQSPPEVWIAIDRKSRKPAKLPTRVRIMSFSGAMLTYGVIRVPMLGAMVSITSPARTVVDCFRYRNKVGLDVAMEALHDAFQTHKATIDEIWHTAEVCRISTVIRPYLEALAV
ncbi:MAG: type IV toxin-antitoxin system AbiEi family antitoxin domain-containing protein [Thermodesulfobacteriota bacterium]